MYWYSSCFCFFFQAEDGIRDHCVTGVQTCALPISHRPSLVTAAPAGALPTWMVRTTLVACGSIRVTVPSSSLAAHTPSRPTATALAPSPTSARPTTASLAGSILVTVPSRLLATHTAPAPTAMALGPFPTGIGRTTALELGLIRATVLSPALVTHTAPNPAATPLGLPPTGIVATGRPLLASIRDSELSRLLATHTAPAPTATWPDRASSGTCPTSVPAFRPISPRLFEAIPATLSSRSAIRSATSAVATSKATRSPAAASRPLDRRRPADTTGRSPPDSRRSTTSSATGVGPTSRKWLRLPAVWLASGSAAPAAARDAGAVSCRPRPWAACSCPEARSGLGPASAGAGRSNAGSWAKMAACSRRSSAPGVDTQLLDQHRPGPLIGQQGIGLPARAVQGHQQLRPQPLPQRLVPDQPLQLGDQLPMATQPQLGLDPILQRTEPQLGQAVGLGRADVGVQEPLERPTAPQPQRLTQHQGGVLGLAVGKGAAGLAGQLLEPGRIQRPWRHPQ